MSAAIAVTDANSPLAGYSPVSLPNLSTLRRPPDERASHSFRVHEQATDTLLVVALARTLGAYCGVKDVLIGWQRVAERPSVAEHEFVAARTCWDDAPTWESLLQRNATVVVGEGFSGLPQALGSEEDAGHSSLAAVVSPDAAYDHPLVAYLDARTSTVTLRYSTLVFHSSTAELLGNHLDAVITHIIERPAENPKSVSFLPCALLSVVEQREETSYKHIPVCRTVPDYVKRIADMTPDLHVLEFYPDLYQEDALGHVETVTYHELHRRSNQFAAYLRDRGLKQEDRVALCMARGIEFHVCMLGIFKAGGCYVPIDPELPDERRNFIAQDSAARFVFTADNVQEHIHEAQRFSDEDTNAANPEDLAYMLYTSGTTGTPKGCLLTHEGFAHAIHALSWFANQAGPNKRIWPQQGRYLAVASIAFDVHLAETFVPLALGMTLVSGPRAQLLEDLPRWIDEMRVTHVGIVPSLIEATMLAVTESVESAGDVDAENAMALAYIASGGEKMSDSILEKWADHPLVTLANFYGPSEVTIGCSARLMTSNTRKENVGRIFENCSAYVVDENLDILMRGGVGELVVGGRLVGRGYHNRPDLTEKAFIDWEGGKAYRTGDLVRLMPDDSIEIMGRIDTQIKLRGVRIESEGISAVIREAAKAFPGLPTKTSPDVSTVLARHPLLQTDQLVSFIAWDPNMSIAVRRTTRPKILAHAPHGLMKALRDACARGLASYMRPAHIVPLDFLPLSSNGKTENKVLVAVFQAESLEGLSAAGVDERSAGGDAPRGRRPLTASEGKIADAVAGYTAVRREQLAPTSNLFELGFDSLRLVRLATALRSVFARQSPACTLNITVADLIQNPTIEELDALLREDHASVAEGDRESFSAAFEKTWRPKVEETMDANAIESVLPTFPVQDGVLYRSADFDTLYVQHVILKLNKDASVEKLKNAWARLMRHHPILRTVFQFSTSIVQVVLKEDVCELPWTEHDSDLADLETFTNRFFELDADEIAKDINQNISSKPPFRLHLYRSGASTYFLSVAIHHSIYDGISLEYLLQDAEALYNDNALAPPVPPAQVLDAVNRFDAETATRFWQDAFDGFSWAKIPGRTAPGGEVAQTASLRFADTLQAWEERAAKAKVSVQALLTASFGVCLGRHLYGGDADVVFGIIRSGRSFADARLNESRYPLLSVNPMRVKVNEASSIIHEVQRDIGRALPFEFFPLSRLQPVLRPGKGLFEALFSLSIDEGTESTIWDSVKSAQPQADYILAVEVVLDRKAGCLRADCAFTEPLSRSFVNELLEDLEATAHGLVEGKPALSRVGSSNALLSPTLVPSRLESLTSEDESEEEPMGPVDEGLEARIRAAVSRFLRIEEGTIANTVSLITLGLDSIKSVGLVRMLRQEGLKLTASELMRYPTIRRIAARQCSPENKPVDREERQAEAMLNETLAEIKANFDLSSVKLREDDSVEVYPTTELQSGMLSQTVSSGGQLYVHAFPFTLSAEVDLARLRAALQKAMLANSILRTSFHFISNLGCWVQAVHSYFELNWSDVEVDDTSSSLNQVIEEWIATLDFSSEDSFARPPVHLRLYRAPDGSRTLVLVMHHALYDGISIARLSHVMAKYYHDEEPSPASQFVDLIEHFLYQERHGTQYWLNVLSNFERTQLVRSVQVRDAVYCPPVQLEATVPITEKQFGKACMEFDATTQCFGQAALAKVLARIYEKHDIVFGRVVSGRNTAKAENVIGPTITTLPCRVNFVREMTNMGLVRMIHRGNTTSLKWQHSSLRTIQRQLGVTSLWDAIILFQPANEEGDDNAPWRFADTEDEIAKIQYPLNIELHQQNDGVIVRAACQSDFLTELDLSLLLKEFAQAMQDIIDEPQAIALTNFPISGRNSVASPDGLCVDDDGSESLTNESGTDFHLSAQQEQLHEIIAISTKVPSSIIRPSSSLVSLGVDSISAIQISSKARKAGLTLHAGDILRCETLSDLYSVLSLDGKSVTVNEEEEDAFIRAPSPTLNEALLRRIGASPEVVDKVYPASAGIKWLVGMWQLSGRSRFQHAFAFKLPQNVDKDRLKSAWSRVASESAILRSTFASTDSSNLHMVEFKHFPSERLWIERQSNSDVPGAEAVSEVMKELVSSPLSTVIPPAQAVYLRHMHETYFILHLHHCQYDAWSLKLIVNDIERIYAGETPIGSNNYESFIQHYLAGIAREEQMHYWSTHFSVPFVPSLLPRIQSDERKNTQGRGVLTIAAALGNLPALRQRAQQSSLSLNAIFLACWARVQATYSHAESATFGLWHLGRTGDAAGMENLTYPCMNVLPVHIDITGSSTHELCNHVQKTLRSRTAVIEQSYMEDISKWVAHSGILCNVFVNIVVTYEDDVDVDDGRGKILEPVNTPYYMPKISSTEIHPSAEKLAVSDLIEDALLIDIVASDSDVALSLEYSEEFLHATEAQELIKAWAETVREVLDI